MKQDWAPSVHGSAPEGPLKFPDRERVWGEALSSTRQPTCNAETHWLEWFQASVPQQKKSWVLVVPGKLVCSSNTRRGGLAHPPQTLCASSLTAHRLVPALWGLNSHIWV